MVKSLVDEVWGYKAFCGALALGFTRKLVTHGFRGKRLDDERDRVPIELRGSERFRNDGPLRIMVVFERLYEVM